MTNNSNIPFSIEPYGFKYGAAEVTRIASDEKKGWVILEIKTPKQNLHLQITKTGKINVYKIHPTAGELCRKLLIEESKR